MSENFHDLFKQSVPESPPTHGWAGAARRRRRRRQVAAGGVAAVIGLAVPLALNLPGTDQPVVASPEPVATSPAPTPTTPEPEETVEPTVDPSPTQPSEQVSLSPTDDGNPGAAACYDEAGEPVMDRMNTGTIPMGAARAWLCTNPQFYGTVGPLEPLVTDVDVLVEALYAQPEVSDESAQEAAEVYTVIFEFDDGGRMSFTGDAQDSTLLTDGENRLQGSVAFFENEVAARWEAQRASVVSPVGEYAPPRECPATSRQQALLPVALDAITGGYACASEGGESRVVDLEGSLAAEIGREALTNAEPVEAADESAGHVLVLANEWGDQVLLRRAGGRYEFRGDGQLMGWTPGNALATDLDGLLNG